MGSVVLWGFAKVIAISLVPVALMGAALHAGDFVEWVQRTARRLHLVRRRPVEPTGLPLERLVADLRRLYPQAHFPRRGVRMPKQRGIVLAYDERLVDTARALGVPTTLTLLPPEGFDHEAERLRLEHALTEAGIVWQVQLPEDPAA